MGRRENLVVGTTSFDWTTLCDDFQPLDKYVCPNNEQVQHICEHSGAYFVPGVRFNYCRPLFETIEDEDLREACERWCINYVAKDQGDCCRFTCF